jgi:hypothetical protein
MIKEGSKYIAIFDQEAGYNSMRQAKTIEGRISECPVNL